jgi:hypothetical protein
MARHGRLMIHDVLLEKIKLFLDITKIVEDNNVHCVFNERLKSEIS